MYTECTSLNESSSNIVQAHRHCIHIKSHNSDKSLCALNTKLVISACVSRKSMQASNYNKLKKWLTSWFRFLNIEFDIKSENCLLKYDKEWIWVKNTSKQEQQTIIKFSCLYRQKQVTDYSKLNSNTTDRHNPFTSKFQKSNMRCIIILINNINAK